MASKYCAWAAGMLIPTAMNGSPLTLNRCVALPPWATYAMSSAGYALVRERGVGDRGSSCRSTTRRRSPRCSLQTLDQGVACESGERRDLQQGGSHRGCVGYGLSEDRLTALIDQEAAGDGVRDHGERQAGDERGQAEEQRHTGAET